MLFFVITNFWLISGNVRSEECIQREYGEGKIVCVCNATYCDTLPSNVIVTKGKYITFQSNREGLRFYKSEGDFTVEPS
jgi:O-Glycosyl hydrolase family 30.